VLSFARKKIDILLLFFSEKKNIDILLPTYYLLNTIIQAQDLLGKKVKEYNKSSAKTKRLADAQT